MCQIVGIRSKRKGPFCDQNNPFWVEKGILEPKNRLFEEKHFAAQKFPLEDESVLTKQKRSFQSQKSPTKRVFLEKNGRFGARRVLSEPKKTVSEPQRPFLILKAFHQDQTGPLTRARERGKVCPLHLFSTEKRLGATSLHCENTPRIE